MGHDLSVVESVVAFAGGLRPLAVRGQLVWETLRNLRVIRILRNPNYTQDYAYGLDGPDRRRSGQQRRSRRRPRAEWHIIEDHHEGYVSRDDWVRVQAILDGNRPTNYPPVLGGAALLQGLLWCLACNRRIKVLYERHTVRGRLPAYVCRHMEPRGVQYVVRRCTNIKAYTAYLHKKDGD